ncbi:tigger transposable element-derived protein 4-like [Gigantopelta aegis]|uniref:tigger transposable element-derived protein 4-like n=1 Tax=Gigantopelta aegis TaxID=1735272 RepID=UPI001B889B9A|nr:tigger transposable element-derived protein 4-like [Gigantopelta aegis]
MTDTKTSRKRKALDLDVKFQIVAAVDLGQKSKKDIAAEFGIPKSTLSTILKQRETILSKCQSSEFNTARKRIRTSEFQDVDDALFLWFKSARNKNIALSGPLLMQKADELAAKLGHVNFKANNAWVERFKQRLGIISKAMHGESAAVNQEVVDNWLTSKLPNYLAVFHPKDIFNADETGLFYKLVPQRTLQLKGEQCHGGKKSKDRITLLVTANMTGTEKLKLLVIGKSAKPRCFKNVRSLPVDYRSNKKAWMTGALFTEWVKDLDKSMKRQKRKILLLVDNCPAHPKVSGLTSITLTFLPPNTTSKIQPKDQGIIANVKVNYRREMMSDIIKAFDSQQEHSVSILTAINTAHRAWRHVTSSCIVNCFAKGGFKSAACSESSEHPVSKSTDSVE